MSAWPGGGTTEYLPREFVDYVGTGVYNVRDKRFAGGAKGDGTTDDTAAIQAALTAAAAAGGGTVHVPGALADYRTGTLRIDSYVCLRGDGPGASVIRLKDGYVGDLLKTVGFESLTGTTPTDAASGPKKFQVRDLTLHGNCKGVLGAGVGQSKGWCFRVFGQSYLVDNVEFVEGQMGGVYSEWRSDTGGGDMETFFSNFKIKDWGMADAVLGGPVVTSGIGPHSYGMYFNGPHDTILINGIVATLNSNIRPESNPRSYGIYLDGVGQGGQAGGAAGELLCNVHIWGRCHYGLFPNQTKFTATGCVAEGAFICNVKLSTGSVWTGGEIYGNNGFYSSFYDEVGVQVGDEDLVDGFNCARAQVVNTFMTNFGPTGRWFNFVNSSGNNRFQVCGHSGSAPSVYKGPIYMTGDDFDLNVHNNQPLSVHSEHQFKRFQYGLGMWVGGAPTGDASVDFGRPVGESMVGALYLDGVANKLHAVFADGFRGVRLRLPTEPQQMFGTVDPSAGAGVAAPVASIYQRQNGTAGSLYLKTGVADTAWVLK